MTNDEFIAQHLADDVRALALKKAPEGVDAPWCLQQIEGWQTARAKMPSWAAVAGLWYPPHLPMEQCSSEQTALYKRSQVERLLPSAADRAAMADFTGGYGVDFSFLAPLFGHSVYVEQREDLCAVARHNFPLLGLRHADIVQAETSADSPLLHDGERYGLAYLDPARRDGAGRKTVAIADCSPDLTRLMPLLLDKAAVVMVKLSPMLDVSQALRDVPCVREVHAVSVKGECKELLLVCSRQESDLRYLCVNLSTADAPVAVDARRQTSPAIGSLDGAAYLYEPNASVLKLGVQDAVAEDYGLLKLHPRSNLYVGTRLAADYPGRRFRITGSTTFAKRSLKDFLKGTTQANLTIRNFPSTVAELRKRLNLREGGSAYLFATTVAQGADAHVLIKCEKISNSSGS